ncbi:Acyltransferase [Aquimixticola soesokkakensis]|uniref:Acyltransferase n=1 Tax=Aquimixticola soesokkakensis TaxID=1519096 RepID=A0A1Y5SK97_9RHOB|nr:lysophospholipid acyltransferase family protein [Aquimixticola soesokkakensis]SLN41034.1 Acyltransferase [Aquimixticola soesokkakensis]
MIPLWEADTPPDPVVLRKRDWGLVVLRAVPIVLFILLCLILLLVCRGVERLLVGDKRPVSSIFPYVVCRFALLVLGLKLTVTGRAMAQRGAIVANHSSWLDILVLNATHRLFFVSKAEVSGWAGIGTLAKATGTVFINRDRREAAAQKQIFEDRLRSGHKLLFFPEGTSTDSLRVLPFKSTLFAAFFTPELRETVWVQPCSVVYRAPEGQPARFYGWWGDMAFGPSALKVLAARPQGSVEVVYHPALKVSQFADRKRLTQVCEEAVRAGLPDRL